METQNEKTYHATREEAQKIIKAAKAGSTFSVSIRMDLPIEGDSEHVFRDGGASYLTISRKEALRLARDLVSEILESRGARLKIRSYERESYRKGSSLEKHSVTCYWIG
jgi:hypothetical protein